MSDDKASIERFKIMERKLYFGIMMPGMILTLIFGIWMLFSYAWETYSQSLWLHIKLCLLVVLVAYHLHCGKLLMDFKHDRNQHSHVFYRWYNEFPVLILVAIVLLATIKPF